MRLKRGAFVETWHPLDPNVGEIAVALRRTGSQRWLLLVIVPGADRKVPGTVYQRYVLNSEVTDLDHLLASGAFR